MAIESCMAFAVQQTTAETQPNSHETKPLGPNAPQSFVRRLNLVIKKFLIKTIQAEDSRNANHASVDYCQKELFGNLHRGWIII
ncbi:hypothetical protein CEXT_393561 [Caerostris extrusa]|uniref:Uncharacterized protein n=1 Tax=Caerostris extrusa TaxID=172846 RepID=A0AAV4N2K8_CAEEX|nr:hypothetical protein CEXT_393561 [Caerostris extrusa]